MDHDEDFYASGTWHCYDRDLARIEAGEIIPGAGAYMPDPIELRERAADVRWLTEQGYDEAFADSVILHGSPEMWVVRRFHDKYGQAETLRRLRPFLVDANGDDV